MLQHDEVIIWQGRPSQWVNLRPFTFGVCLILLSLIWHEKIDALLHESALLVAHTALIKTLLVVIILFAMAWKWLKVYTHHYVLTDELFRESFGVFDRHTLELELYRIKDTSTFQPFELRVFGLGNVEMVTSDRSSPYTVIVAVPQSDLLRQVIRERVEIMRQERGVFEVD